MNKNILISIFLYLLFFKAIYAQITISGKITDKYNNEPLPGATIFIPDLETGAVTNENGIYKITNLPKSKFFVQVIFIGYAQISQIIDLSEKNIFDFALEPSVVNIHEVVITGSAILSDDKRTSVSVVSLNKNEIITSGASNIISILTNVPGISEITTGGGVSKPVIRGLAYNHVVTLNEGVRQEGNQWGPEHGMEIDQFSADKVEILKGPASLFYGSDALGGVINILETTIPTESSVKGELSSDFSTNNKLTANSLMFEGNKKGFVFGMRATYKNAASFKTPIEYVYNSGFNENNYSMILGVHKKWGFTHLHLSQFNAFIGAVDGARDSMTQKFIDAGGNIVSDNKLKSRKLELPFNNVQHNKITSVSDIIINGGQLKINLGYQSNHRKEFDDNMDDPNVYFLLNTLTFDAKYLLPAIGTYEIAFGISGMTQNNMNKGNEFVVPDYFSQDLGGFGYVKKSFNKITMNAGIRYDLRNINGKSLFLDSLGNPTTRGDTIFQKFNDEFHAISGAIGFTYSISEKINLKFNIGRGYRAPNIYELATSANGAAPDPGTFSFNAGNYNLKPETSIQIDGEITANYKYFNASISAFYNTINNYIYQRNINNERKLYGNQMIPVYRFVQGNSLLKGFECELNIHLLKSMVFENSIAYVNGTNISTKIPLPFIPALYSKHALKWDIISNKKSVFTNISIRGGFIHTWEQNRFDSFETKTGAYTLYNISLNSDLKVGKQKLTIFINGENITNVKYFDHLNRFKILNIYNIGRNITFGVFIPFENHEK